MPKKREQETSSVPQGRLNLAQDASRNISPKEWKKAVASGITLLSKEVLPGERSNSLEYRVYAN
jgi:hypothetical protein